MMELVMFVGIPASGKSTYTERYRQLGYQILSSDEIQDGMMRDAALEALSEKDKNRMNSQAFETVRRKTAGGYNTHSPLRGSVRYP